MNEEDLNEALHDVMVRSNPPASMDPARALEQARRVRKRRRVAWGAVIVVPLVAAVGVGPALLADLGRDSSVGQMVAGATPSTYPEVAQSKPVASAAPTTTRKTGDPWPEGQTDRTATTGPRADRSVTLMDDLGSAVPEGFSTPDLKYPDGRAMRRPQTQYASNEGERDYWEYRAGIPVQKDDRVGQLLVQSTTPDGRPASSPCKLAPYFGTGSCAVVDVGGKKVGVVTAKSGESFDQWAVYRHDDGTVVFLAQAKKSDDAKRKPLTQPVFSAQQLADLVTSEKFKVSS